MTSAREGARGTALLRARQFFGPRDRSAEGWNEHSTYSRAWESAYRRRWQHDRVVRSTHGVNCTGSCSWRIHVKDGLVTWETQQVDYPSNGPDVPDYEPRGCPRGASFSWYVYSPVRPKYPYVRGVLMEMFLEARARLGDPVEAWASIVDDPDKARAYKSKRGKGGFVRAAWSDVIDLIAAAHVHTVRRWGPDRVVGFSPIPAMSMVSYTAGTRFLSLIGGVCLSFYDWYADLPPASPQTWGDQTDVPESADWWNSSYMILWGSNIPQTRTPDAHFMTEARYRGTKVVVVSPDYAGHTKFADHWLPAVAGTDGALAMAMGHVILKEFYVDRRVPYFDGYARRFTDLPFLVTLRERADGELVPDAFLRSSDLDTEGEHADWRMVVLDEATGEPAVPNGAIGDRWGAEGAGRWNLDLDGLTPALTLLGRHDELAEVLLPRFDGGETEGGTTMRRGVPATRVGGRLVTTVLDLMLAHYGVAREGLPGEWPSGYDDPAQPHTPAWQQEHTGVDAGRVVRIAREFAANAEATNGRSMIVMGAGLNHWYHGDETYRAVLALLLLCGCQGVNGGGWAHYVGQEKVRPITGWATVAFALDWLRPPRQQPATPFWYLMSDQWRYETYGAGEFASPAGNGALDSRHLADCVALGARLGWLPMHPAFERNPLDVADDARAAGADPAEHAARELGEGRLRFACEVPDRPESFPRVLTLWRANLLGSSSKGHEYFLRHILGVPDAAIRAAESSADQRPDEVEWIDEAPEGKLDLFTTIDFRMNGSCVYSDVVLPAATWYEKHDLSSTDLHPFVHPFNAAIPPPWEAKSDWDAFNRIAERFSELAEKHLGTRTDIVAAPLLHDSPDELAQPGGRVLDWRAGECEPLPGRTMPKLVAVERDYPAVHARMQALGPLVEQAGIGAKGIAWKPEQEVEELGRRNGVVRTGPARGRPSLARDVDVCEAILALSGTTNGRLATESFRVLEERVGRPLAEIPAERADERLTFADVSIQPRKVIASAEWSGLESRDRRYSPFTANIEHSIPWRTLTGRQQLYLDHEWMLALGEGLPAYRPPVDVGQLDVGGEPQPEAAAEVTVRYLTPHSKWSIHSEFQDNLHMLTLFRGGPAMWISVADAEKIGVRDNDWLEVYNKHGTVACRAVVSHRVPTGVALYYHSQDRHVNVPVSEVSGARGGTDNSLTRISIKPTHLIGGYAQLSWGFNYYGPTGPQRDQLIVIRKRASEVRY
ncbi:MAG TPA: nitrate reductase subunit alpha [Thermoleophilaceae bacterium]|nr:nitrate reductase subunit alpha [Thermoleophilaceae bacterium]